MGRRSLRVGLVGVGNCASSFVQGLSYYGDAAANEPVPGLMSAELGGYRVGDIEVSSAFDVAAGKVGRDVSDAIAAAPNNTHRFAEVPATGVKVERGPTLDGLGRYVAGELEEADGPPADVVEVLRRSRTEIDPPPLALGQ